MAGGGGLTSAAATGDVKVCFLENLPILCVEMKSKFRSFIFDIEFQLKACYLTPHQHGFRKGFSTKTQLISVLDDWLSLLDKRIRTDVLLIDFQNLLIQFPTRDFYLSLIFFGLKTSCWTTASMLKPKRTVLL